MNSIQQAHDRSQEKCKQNSQGKGYENYPRKIQCSDDNYGGDESGKLRETSRCIVAWQVCGTRLRNPS